VQGTSQPNGAIEESANPDKASDVLTYLQDMDLNERLVLYRTIVKIYEENLFRLPSMKELNYYTYRIKTDTSFSYGKLTQLIQLSKEYKILEKNQTNLVNGELEGNITDAQIKLIVTDAYKQVYNTKIDPSLEFEQFMKQKYSDYKLDNAKFMHMLRVLKQLDEDNLNMSQLDVVIPTTKANVSGNATSSNKSNVLSNAKSNVAAKANKSQTQTQSVSSSIDKTTLQNAPLQSTANTTQEEAHDTDIHTNTTFGPRWNPKIEISEKACDKSPYNKKRFFDMLYENIKFEQKSPVPCSNASSTLNERNRFAELQDKRNKDELGYSCSRNNYFTQVDEEIMSGTVNAYDKNILPQFRNTKYGAFLDDAANTKVGSIMPRFVFKEYV